MPYIFMQTPKEYGIITLICCLETLVANHTTLALVYSVSSDHVTEHVQMCFWFFHNLPGLYECVWICSFPRHAGCVQSGRKWSWNTTDSLITTSTGQTVTLHTGGQTTGSWPRYTAPLHIKLFTNEVQFPPTVLISLKQHWNNFLSEVRKDKTIMFYGYLIIPLLDAISVYERGWKLNQQPSAWRNITWMFELFAAPH